MSDKQAIIDRLISNTAEVITEEEFRERVANENNLTHYIGFEISGHVHIGQGIMTALVIKDLAALGVKCTVWLADWHTWANHKLDGTKETAAAIGTGYFTEAIKACYQAVDGNPDDIEFRLANDWYAEKGINYFEQLMSVAQNVTEARIKRSVSIMGKEAGENVEMSTLMYPLMQVADIFMQDIDIAHAGMEQRKAHVVMRDVAQKINPDQPKPIALHHPLVDSLDGEVKMSKSRPDSAVFIHDTPKDIERKIKKAFCQEKEIDKNPILNWAQNLLFWDRQAPFTIERKEEHGGNLEFRTYKELESSFASGDLHPMDLKSAVAKELIELLAPAREHFAKPEVAEKKAVLDEILKQKNG